MARTALIVEDHPLFRGALIELMRPIVGREQTVAVGSAEEGLRMLMSRAQPDIVLLDLGLPGLKGVEAIRAFVRLLPSLPLVVVSASEERHEANNALQAGARVVVSKAVPIDVLTDVVERVLAGSLVTKEWITTDGKRDFGSASALNLTPRQQQTLNLLAQGHSNKEIGLRMGLAEITVKIHVSAVFRILGVINRTQAVLAAREHGLLDDGALPEAR